MKSQYLLRFPHSAMSEKYLTDWRRVRYGHIQRKRRLFIIVTMVLPAFGPVGYPTDTFWGPGDFFAPRQPFDLQRFVTPGEGFPEAPYADRNKQPYISSGYIELLFGLQNMKKLIAAVGPLAWPIMIPEATEYLLAELGVL